MRKNRKKNREVRCATKQTLISRTDLKGNIIYYNPTFQEVNGYRGISLINKPHNIVRHPDMPKIIFKIIWSIIKQGYPIQAIVKNKTNDGNYYWAMIDWRVQKDNNKIVSYLAHAQQAPDSAIKEIEPLYAEMLKIEKEHDSERALAYLHAYLDNKGVTYNQYIKKLTKHRELKCLCDFIKHKLLIN